MFVLERERKKTSSLYTLDTKKNKISETKIDKNNTEENEEANYHNSRKNKKEKMKRQN